MEKPPYRYDYHALDKFLKEDYDPREIGNKLDEIMSRLVEHASMNEDYRGDQAEDHYILKQFRDIFWWHLPKMFSNL